MIIQLELFQPYSSIVGKKKIQLELNKNCNEKVNIEIVVKELIRQYPSIQTLFSKKLNQNVIYGSCFPVREGKVLLMKDEVKDKDNIRIYGSLIGG